MPLSADVAPQMTLFGAPAPARRRSGGAGATRRGRRAEAPDTGDRHRQTRPRTEIPAFERRARLRDERHRLVSEVRRRDGTSHREINAWLNRKLGIASVEQATLADLERSVELLVGKLSAAPVTAPRGVDASAALYARAGLTSEGTESQPMGLVVRRVVLRAAGAGPSATAMADQVLAALAACAAPRPCWRRGSRCLLISQTSPSAASGPCVSSASGSRSAAGSWRSRCMMRSRADDPDHRRLFGDR